MMILEPQNSQTWIWPFIICWMPRCVILTCTEFTTSKFELFLHSNCEVNSEIRMPLENQIAPKVRNIPSFFLGGGGHGLFWGHSLKATWILRIPFEFKTEVSNLKFQSLRFAVPNLWMWKWNGKFWVAYFLQKEVIFWACRLAKKC